MCEQASAGVSTFGFAEKIFLQYYSWCLQQTNETTYINNNTIHPEERARTEFVRSTIKINFKVNAPGMAYAKKYGVFAVIRKTERMNKLKTWRKNAEFY